MKQMLKNCSTCGREIPVMPGYKFILVGHVCAEGIRRPFWSATEDPDQQRQNFEQLMANIESWEISTEIPEWFKERVSEISDRLTKSLF